MFGPNRFRVGFLCPPPPRARAHRSSEGRLLLGRWFLLISFSLVFSDTSRHHRRSRTLPCLTSTPLRALKLRAILLSPAASVFSYAKYTSFRFRLPHGRVGGTSPSSLEPSRFPPVVGLEDDGSSILV